jgi:type IV pilus assembly protein PilM
MANANPVGLDIGSMSIRAVETRRTKDGPVVTNFGYVLLPPGAVSGGVVHDPTVVTGALRQLWAGTRFGTKEVVLGVTNPQVVVREMAVANLPDRELRKSLPFQVRDMLPLPVERSLLDFYRLEDAGSNKTVRGLLVAAPKEPVLAAVKAVERAGLRVSRVDLASFALLRSSSWLDANVEAIVDIGARVTSVVIHLDGVPIIVRSVPRGGAEITEMLATRIGATVTEAEALKCRVGLNADDGPETAEVVREAVRPLVNEIRSSFAYLTAGDRPSTVARLVLTGGGSQLPGLVELLSSQIGMNVMLGDPTMRLREARRNRSEELERLRASAAVSIGLTMGAV